jgi:hypothetical protein
MHVNMIRYIYAALGLYKRKYILVQIVGRIQTALQAISIRGEYVYIKYY